MQFIPFIALLVLIFLVVIALTEIHATEVTFTIKARKIRVQSVFHKCENNSHKTPEAITTAIQE